MSLQSASKAIYGDLSDRCIIVDGQSRILKGEIHLQGAKNSALLLLAAALLTDYVDLENLPKLTDVDHMISLLEECSVSINRRNDHLRLSREREFADYVECSSIAKKIRTSILLLGPMLSTGRSIRIPLPGGCNLGTRAIDMHIEALVLMGAEISEVSDEYGSYILAANDSGKLSAIDYRFHTVSVTGTANIMMAAVLADGITILRNIAIEPEIINLIECLNKMGAKISFIGVIEERHLHIEGVNNLNSAYHRIMEDRIEAGTYMIAAAMIGEGVKIFIDPDIVVSIINVLVEIGADICVESDGVRISKCNLNGIDVSTGPYPEFPTDLQPQLTALLSIAGGTSKITETMFDNRFCHVAELVKMGANITINKERREIVIAGVDKLYGADIYPDAMRGAAALILAGIAAEGVTKIHSLHYLYRGYSDIVGKFQNCGIDIKEILNI